MSFEGDVQQKQRILKFHQFVLHNKSQDIRDELYEYIISRVIYDHGQNNQILKTIDVLDLIEKDYGVTKIHPKVISSTIERLSKKKYVSINNELISLSSNKIKEIKENNSALINLIETVKLDLESQIRTIGVSDDKAKEITKEFFALLAKTFSGCGQFASKIIVDGHNPLDIFNNSEFKFEYQKLILHKVLSEQRDALDNIFNDFFSNITEEKSKLFFTLVQAYALLQIFNVDPELKKIQDASLTQKKIYLDTNILIGLLFEENNNHEPIQTTLQITKQLGAQLLITSLTKIEFETWLHSCETAYVDFKKFPKKFVDAFKQKNTNAPFFNTYHKRLLNNPRLSIREFCKYYENFLVILENQYQIKIDAEKIEPLKDDAQFQELLDYILRITPEKGKRVSVHDALCILYVKRQRIKFHSDETGPYSWFLTTDSSLKRVERKIFPQDEFTASVRYGVWLQIISPLLSPILVESNNINKLFTKLISTNFSSSNTVTEEDVLNILSAFIDDTEITLETLKEIVGNTHVRETLRKLRKATLEHDVDEQKRLGEVSISQVTKTLRSKHNTETVNLKKALNNFTTRLEQQEKQMQEQNKVLQEQNKIMQEQSEILKKQTAEIKTLQKEKDDKNWGMKFLKKLFIGMVIGVATLLIFYFLVASDLSSITSMASIEVTILAAIFGTWYGVHKSKSNNT